MKGLAIHSKDLSFILYKGDYIVHDIIMTTITALIPVAVSVVGYLLVKYVKTPSRLQALTDLVNAAVVFAERTGAIQQLTGSQQFELAYNFVQDKAKQLGITQMDEELVKTLIEQSWADQKAHLNDVYKSGKEQADGDSAVAEKKQLEDLKNKIAKEQATLDSERQQLKSAAESLSSSLDVHKQDPAPDKKSNTPDSKPVTDGTKPVSE